MKGYKATDENMQCRGYQFEIGKWHEHEGELEMCGAGFHFCDHPSGPWAYYSLPGTRIFEIEADDVAETPYEPGADLKRVCRRIRLVREITVDGDYNTGNCNTGDYNTGNRNTGYYNTGNCNTGNCNTGDYNTGNCNTGYYNTGNGNATDYSSGFFCAKEPKVICFDVQTKLTRAAFMDKYPEYWDLANDLLRDDPINFEAFKNLPGITERKLKALHKKFIEGRKNQGEQS